MSNRGWVRVTCLAVALTMAEAANASAQVAKSFGVVDANTIAEKDLAALPNMTPAIAKAVVAKRPSQHHRIERVPARQGPDRRAGDGAYRRLFVHINLNTATAEEILLVPGAGTEDDDRVPEYRRGRPGRSSTGRSASTSAAPKDAQNWRSSPSSR